ncbi:hypothetical protein SAMN04488072_105146 [Lentibacillus halodurans]|uniref:Uncharacterized protein n=1 Tax=Lentibacillus halodurans TaxID=237679 RepID=A0A1I0XKI7_9BACI|nr:hypothetical protein SAMN04488072_105146 [Lentibacillus halodurans]
MNGHSRFLNPCMLGMINSFGASMLKKAFEKWKTFGFKNADDYILRLQHVFRDESSLGGKYRKIRGYSLALLALNHFTN